MVSTHASLVRSDIRTGANCRKGLTLLYVGCVDGRNSLPVGRASADGRVVDCSDETGRLTAEPVRRHRARIAVLGALLALAVCLVAAASASAFNVQGSVQQVDVTGVAANAQMSLLNSAGTVVSTQNADAQGGLLFRNVAPASGYKARLTSTGESSGPITVHSAASAPWDPSVYNQEIPDNGYTYLTTRDGTKLAIDVHPPTSPAGEPGVPSSFQFGSFPQLGVPTPNYAPPYPYPEYSISVGYGGA